MNRNKKILAGAAMFGALAVAAGGGAFTAGNTVADSTVGFGSANVTGADVVGTSYTVVGTTVTAIVFALDPAQTPAVPDGTAAEINLTDPALAVPFAAAWNACAAVDGTAHTITCTIASVAIASIDHVSLVVHS
jgi:hypothetical protein